MAIRLAFVLLTAIFGLGILSRGQAAQFSDRREAVADRLIRLESETQSLRAEVGELRGRPVRLPPVEATPAGSNAGESFGLEELRGEMKQAVWKRGDFTIVPYGYFWGNMVFSTQRTRIGSYTLFVDSAGASSESEFVVDARNSRLGLDAGGPPLPFLSGAASGGKVEVDFQNSVLSTENKPTIVVRQAYLEVKNDEYRFLAGQTWDVISPIFPGVLNAGACWNAGNVGYRRAQVRGERYIAFSETFLTTAQLSLNQQIFEDGNTSVFGETSNWPIVEGRIGWTLGRRGSARQPITFGLSGHVGEEQFDHLIAGTNVRRRTWSGNVDLIVPVTDRLGFQGELFIGENLGAFLGGIGQGINPLTLDPIRGAGGWFEVWFDWTRTLHSHAGYSVDDPNDRDIAPGGRTYNQCYFGNLQFDISKQFVVGLEASSWKTLYADRSPGDAVRLEFMARYGF